VNNLRVGVDVGGTFTDVVAIADGVVVDTVKVLSTPPDFHIGIRTGVRELLAAVGAPASSVERFVHGATIATNAILTRSGAKTALVTTRGFRDVLELRRMRAAKLYDMRAVKPVPLVCRSQLLARLRQQRA
jgi:N-methylhydantoinase A